MTNKLGIWDQVEKGFRHLAIEKHHQDIDLVRLIIGIIVSSGKDRDICYLYNDVFLYHCYLVGFKAEYVFNLFTKIWKHIDNKMQFNERFLNGEVFFNEE